jgi:hypothetical protein
MVRKLINRGPALRLTAWLGSMRILYLGNTTGLEYETRWPAVQPGRCCFTVSRKRSPQYDGLWLGHEAKAGHRAVQPRLAGSRVFDVIPPSLVDLTAFHVITVQPVRRETPRGAIAGCYRA